MPLPTCTHTNDTGRTCNSVAAKDQKYCPYHLSYRARRLRIAQARARAERFDIKLPPLEDMYAVQSALSQLAEALAADMIDLKRAQTLMSVLRLVSTNFRHADKWQTNLYHSDQSSEVNVAKEYGLPADLDLDIPPEVAFPPPQNSQGVILSEGVAAATDESKDPFVSAGSTGPALDFRPDFPVHPDWLELKDIENTQGPDARALRFKQLESNRARRELRTNRKRYIDIALRLNIRSAAELLAEKKLAEKLAAAGVAPTPEPQLDHEAAVAEGVKKMQAFDHDVDEYLAGKEVKIA